MIDNLALSTSATLTASDTDIDTDAGSDFIVKWNSLAGNPVQGADSHSNGVCTSASDVSIADGSGYLTCDGTYYSDSNDGFIAYSDPGGIENFFYFNCIASKSIGINSGALSGCGYLYNWYTATAGSGIFQSASDLNVSSSICPVGWNLPKGNITSSQNDFGILNNAMANGIATTSSGDASALTIPNWLSNGPFEGALAGFYSTGFGNTGGDYGYYWTSSTHSYTAGHAFTLRFGYGNVWPGTVSSSRRDGLSIRCFL